MKKVLPIAVVILVIIAGILILQKSLVRPAIVPKPEVTDTGIKKVDLSTQPEWVRQLKVSGRKGSSPNGLDNFTLTASGIDSGVSTVTYIVQYQTSNKGVQGALGMSPQEVSDGVFSKTIDLGTCSTKSCVRHDGVTEVEVELDFSDGSIWTGDISL